MTPEFDPGVRLLVYGGLLVATPLTFVLLFRLVDRLSLDGYVDQYQEVAPEAGRGVAEPPAVDDGNDRDDGDDRDGDGDDEVACPRCGERNEPEFTFCHACQAQIGV